MLRHLTEVERGWFRVTAAGLDLPPAYASETEPDADFDATDSLPADQVLAEIAAADAAVAHLPLDHVLHVPWRPDGWHGPGRPERRSAESSHRVRLLSRRQQISAAPRSRNPQWMSTRRSHRTGQAPIPVEQGDGLFHDPATGGDLFPGSSARDVAGDPSLPQLGVHAGVVVDIGRGQLHDEREPVAAGQQVMFGAGLRAVHRAGPARGPLLLPARVSRRS